MPLDPLKVYDLGQQGVNVVVSPLHQRPATELLQGQNAIYDKASAVGGLGKRGGTAKLNASAINSGATIKGAINLPLPDPDSGQATIFVLIAYTGNRFWLRSTDGGTTWTRDSTYITSTDGDVAPNFELSSLNYEGAVTPFGRAYLRSLLESGGSPHYERLVRYDGNLSIPLSRLPEDQAGGGVHDTAYNTGLDGLYYFNDRVYFTLIGYGGGFATARVMGMNISTEAAIQIGQAFGSGGGSRTTPVTFPVIFQEFLGRLFFFPWDNGSGNRNVYWIRPDIDTSWTSDAHDPGANYQPTCAAVFNGVLYVGYANGVGTAKVESRTADGTWATSESAPAATTDYAWLTVFDSKLFAMTLDGTTAAVRVFDGTSWSNDTTFAGVSNEAVILRAWGNYLFAITDRAIWRRDTAGVWTKVRDSAALSESNTGPSFYIAPQG